MKKLLGLVLLGSMVALAFAAPSPAFHGSWWKASGTATSLGNVLGQFTATVDWTGRQVGQQGAVTVKLFQPGNPVPVHQNTVQVLEFWGVPDGTGVFFVGCVEFVEPYVHQGVVPGTWTLTGTMRNDLCTGLNNNDFTASYLGAFQLAVHSAGGFGVTHG